MAKGDKIGVCPLCGGDVIENSERFMQDVCEVFTGKPRDI